VPLRPPQIPHRLTRALTRASAVRDRRLTAWAMAQPSIFKILFSQPKYINILRVTFFKLLYVRVNNIKHEDIECWKICCKVENCSRKIYVIEILNVYLCYVNLGIVIRKLLIRCINVLTFWIWLWNFSRIIVFMSCWISTVIPLVIKLIGGVVSKQSRHLEESNTSRSLLGYMNIFFCFQTFLFQHYRGAVFRLASFLLNVSLSAYWFSIK
jgi:hypothetical protein